MNRSLAATIIAALLAVEGPALALAQTSPPAAPEPATPPAAPAPAEPPPAPAQDQNQGQDQQNQGQDQQNQGQDQSQPDEGADQSMPNFEQVELTVDVAKRAVDSLLVIQDKYKDADFGDPSDPAAFAQSMKDAGVYDQVLADLKQYGFTSVEDWARAFMSLWIAGSFVKDGQDPADVDKQIADVEKDTTVSQEERDSTIAWLKAMKPTDNNMKVARELYADPVYKPKLDDMLQIDAGEGVE